VLDYSFFVVMFCCPKVNACFLLSFSHIRKGGNQTLLYDFSVCA